MSENKQDTPINGYQPEYDILGKLDFKYLPDYARFIIDNHLREFTSWQVQLSIDLNLPLMKHLSGYSFDQLIELGMEGQKVLLTYLQNNDIDTYHDITLKAWLNNQLPVISRDSISVEDITLGQYIRRLTYRKFLPNYTSDFSLCTKIMEEVERFTAKAETVTLKLVVSIQQELYKESQELSHTGNWVWELASDRLSWSDEMYRIFGLEPQSDEEVTFEKIASYNHPDDARMVSELIAKSRETHEPYEFYYRIILPGGIQKTVHARGRVLLNENGDAYRMVGTLQDVTERQNLIDRLKQNKELYKQAQALTHIGNWTWDVGTNAITWSDELYRIYGLVPQSETVHFERFIEMVHPDDRERVAGTVKKSLETGIGNEFYHRILLPDGTEKTLHAIGEVELDKNGRVIKMFGTGQDVTIQKNTERDLEEKQTFIRKIADITPSIITAYNIFTGEYIFVNHAVENLLGYEPTEILEKGIEFFLSIIHPDDLTPLIEKNAKSLEIANQAGYRDDEETIEEFEYRMLHKNGFYRWFHTYGTVFSRNKEGKVEVVLNISVDVTDQVAANLELHQKHDELERSYKELESFSYIASHDLKEPLRKIRTYSDRLLNQESLTTAGKDYLDRMIKSASHMQQLIDALLDYSRTNLKAREFEKVDLNDLVEQVKSELSPQLEEKSGTVTVHPLPIVRGVHLHLHQVFSNIIGNAIKYSRTDVPLHITISSTVESTKHIYPNSAFTHFHRITVSDNGIGFEPRYAEQIFELFQRLHAKHEYSGTGIGLAICKKIILNHHGLIKATGTPGEGATFTVYLPVEGAVKS